METDCIIDQRNARPRRNMFPLVANLKQRTRDMGTKSDPVGRVRPINKELGFREIQ